MNPLSRWVKVLLGGVFLALLFGGTWFYRVQEQRVRQKGEHELVSVAQLKAEQIARWREDQLADAELLENTPLFFQDATLLVADPKAEAANLLEFLRFFQKNNDIFDIVLMGPNGETRLSLRETPACHFAEIQDTVASAARNRRPAFADFHVGDTSSAPHVSVVVPIFENADQEARYLGAVILVSDPRQFLYPLIQDWPVPSETAETLLVRRDGDSVLFLNELRHRGDTALKLRIPLTQTDVPAVMAVRGKEGVFEGRDYRGVEVVSALMPVANSPWYLVAKEDAAEAFAVWRLRSRLILGLLAALLGTVLAAGFVIWQRDQKTHYRALYRSEAARRASEERYGITLNSIGDAVIATDAKGRIEFVNPVAEALTGWKADDARGKPLSAVFRIVNEETRANVESPVERVLREGHVVALANHTLLVARDGMERPIADSGAPIHDENGNITGVVLVFRDQTEDRAKENALKREIVRAQQYLDVAGVMMLVLDSRGNVALINQKGYRVLGCAEKDVLGRNWFENFVPERAREMVKNAFVRIMSGQLDMDEYVENHVLTCCGKERLIAWHNAILRNENGVIIGTLSSGEDITDRRAAEDALRESEERFHSLFEQAPLGYQSLSEDGFFIEVNQAWLDTLGYDRDEVLGKWFGDFLAPEYVQAFRERFPLFKAAGQIHSEFEMLHKSGERRFIAFEGRIGHGSDGGFKQTHCILADITERRRAEEALRESEERYRLLVDTSNEGIWSMDGDHVTTYVNQAMADMLGYAPSEILGKKVEEFFFPEDMDFHAKRMERRHAGDDEVYERRFRRKDGSALWTLVSAKVLRDGEGHFAGSFAMFTDITERKRAEEALRLKNTVFDLSQAANSIANADGILTETNAAFLRVWGYPNKDEVIGKPIPDFLENRDDVVAIMTSLDTSGGWEGDYTAKRKDGSLFSAHGLATVIRSETGAVVGYQSSVLDITARKQAEEALRERESLLSAIVQNTPFEFWARDLDGRCFMENAALVNHWGSLLGTRPEDSGVTPEELALWKANNDRAMAGEVLDDEVVYAMDGTPHIFRNIVAPIRIGDEVHGIFGLNVDITERRRAEEALRLQHELAVTLGQTLDLDECLKLCLSAAFRISGMDCGGVYLVDKDTGGLRLVAHEGLSEEFVARASRLGPETPNVRLVQSGQPLYSNHTRITEDNQKLHEGLRALALIPIVHEGRAIACLNIASHLKDDVRQEVRPLLESVAAQAGGFIARAFLYEELRESEEKHRALVNGIPDIVMRFNREGRHLFVSDNVETVVDIPAARFIGRTYRELGFPEPQCRFWEEAVEKVFSTGESFETEFSIKGKHGIVVFNWRLIPEFSPTGKLQTVLSINRDITAHRKAEKDYQTLFHQMLDGFAVHEIICDTSGQPVDYRFLAVNPAFERMTGLDAQDITGKTVLEVMPGTERHWIETYGRVALTGEPAYFESHADDLGKYFEVKAFRPAPGQFACIFMDITERKRAEANLAEQLEELRRWHEVMLGRETRVLDLKHEVNELLAGLGKPPRYPSAESAINSDDPGKRPPERPDAG